MIIGLIEDRPSSQDEISKSLGVKSKAIRKHIKSSVENNYIKIIGTDKNGKRIVANDKKN